MGLVHWMHREGLTGGGFPLCGRGVGEGNVGVLKVRGGRFYSGTFRCWEVSSGSTGKAFSRRPQVSVVVEDQKEAGRL